MMTPEEKITGRDAVDGAWEQATRLFATPKAMRPRKSWLTGVSMDTAADRIQRLLREPRAISLRNIIDALEGAMLRDFLQRTEINLDRAAAAMRLNLVVNISGPVGALVIVNQLLPRVVSDFVALYGMEAIVIGSASLFFLVLLSIWYSYCGVTQARDLAHLTRLYAARRSDAPIARHDYDDEPLNPVELA